MHRTLTLWFPKVAYLVWRSIRRTPLVQVVAKQSERNQAKGIPYPCEESIQYDILENLCGYIHIISIFLTRHQSQIFEAFPGRTTVKKTEHRFWSHAGQKHNLAAWRAKRLIRNFRPWGPENGWNILKGNFRDKWGEGPKSLRVKILKIWPTVAVRRRGRTSCVNAMPSNKPKNVGGCYIWN